MIPMFKLFFEYDPVAENEEKQVIENFKKRVMEERGVDNSLEILKQFFNQ